MINAEMVENPVLEELEDSVPLLDDVDRREEERDRHSPLRREPTAAADAEKKDPFEEIDFGSFFQEYLDPGYRSSGRDGRHRAALVREFPLQAQQPDRSPDVATGLDLRCVRRCSEAAELVIGNLNEDGYLIASDEELLGVAPPAPPEVRRRRGRERIQGSRRARTECVGGLADCFHGTVASESGLTETAWRSDRASSSPPSLLWLESMLRIEVSERGSSDASI